MHTPSGQGFFRAGGGEGGRGFGTQNLVYQKWPDQIFPIVFSTMVTLVWEGGEGVLGEPPPPPWFLIILKKPCQRVMPDIHEPQNIVATSESVLFLVHL